MSIVTICQYPSYCSAVIGLLGESSSEQSANFSAKKEGISITMFVIKIIMSTLELSTCIPLHINRLEKMCKNTFS